MVAVAAASQVEKAAAAADLQQALLRKRHWLRLQLLRRLQTAATSNKGKHLMQELVEAANAWTDKFPPPPLPLRLRGRGPIAVVLPTWTAAATTTARPTQ